MMARNHFSKMILLNAPTAKLADSKTTSDITTDVAPNRDQIYFCPGTHTSRQRILPIIPGDIHVHPKRPTIVKNIIPARRTHLPTAANTSRSVNLDRRSSPAITLFSGTSSMRRMRPVFLSTMIVEKISERIPSRISAFCSEPVLRWTCSRKFGSPWRCKFQ